MKETLLRIVSAIVFIPILYFAAIQKDALYFTLLTIVIAIVSLIELYAMFRKKLSVFLIILVPAVVGMHWIIYQEWDKNYLIGIILAVLLIITFFVVFLKEIEKSLLSLLLNLFAVVYLGLMWGSLIAIKKLGLSHLFVLIVLTWFCDIGAYAVGKTIGKHKLNLTVSPTKTLEGFIGGLLIAFGAGFLATYLLSMPFKWWFILIPFATIVGDLLESLLKRYCGVKDSGKIAPGHGGALDVFDALIFTSPIYYYCLLILG